MTYAHPTYPSHRHVLAVLMVGMLLELLAGWGGNCVLGQASLTQEELVAQADESFDLEQWQQAHRQYAELLSLDGTNLQHQVRYAATLLHDARMRNEGIQRLASLVDEGNMDEEGWHWWGRAMLVSGSPDQAQDAFTKSLSIGGKKGAYRTQNELGIRQAEKLPTSFDLRQDMVKEEANEVPFKSWHRFVNWEEPQSKLLLAPDELLGKQDKREGHSIPMTFIRGEREVFFHSLGSKGSTGWDLYMSTLSSGGDFGEPVRLPDPLNGSEDEMNPVWVPRTQTLYFVSNRPGTMGGMDIWQSSRTATGWTPPQSMGPMVNSLFNEWAYFPEPEEGGAAWLVTDREGEFGAVEAWRIRLDGEPKPPMHLTTVWDVEGETIPGTLQLFDAQTGQKLAVLDIDEAQGQWDMHLPAGSVLKYEFVTAQGEAIEGTYALPDASEPSIVQQRMAMKVVDGRPILEARPLSRMAVPSSDLTWGWDASLQEVRELEFEWVEEEMANLEDWDEDADDSVESQREVIQLQSYPWWDEVQKEERALAASAVAKFVPENVPSLPKPGEFDRPEDYARALNEAQTEWYEYAVSAILALSARDILLEELSWQDAFRQAMEQAQSVWPVGTVNVEQVARLCKRQWSQMGSLYDEGLLPEIRDKESLVEDEEWLLKPWNEGPMVDMIGIVEPVDELAVSLAWTLDSQPDLDAPLDMLDPKRWDLESERKSHALLESEEARAQALADVRVRLALLDAMEPNDVIDESDRSNLLLSWRELAVGLVDSTPAPSEDRPRRDSAEEERNELQAHWQNYWSEELAQSSASEQAEISDWEAEFTLWLEGAVLEDARPQTLMQLAVQTWEEIDGGSVDAGQLAVLQSLNEVPDNEVTEANAHEAVRASWVVAKWAHDPDWQLRTPDEVHSMVNVWPETAGALMNAQRIQWAKALQMDEEEASDGTDLVVETPSSMSTSRSDDAVSETANDEGQQATPLVMGRAGIQLGWFRQNPEFPPAIPGSFLTSTTNESGLSKWVLVLDEGEESELDLTQLQGWLSEANVHDAFEVEFVAGEWVRKTDRPKPTESTARSDGRDVEGKEDVGGMEVKDGEVWLHGAPVRLGDLIGTWYAVQVGAFRGDPQKDWIELAGERLVYEPFDDGLARWYAGVRQSELDARDRLVELKAKAPFSDAFLVRLRNGEREVVTPNSAGPETQSVASSGDAPHAEGAVPEEVSTKDSNPGDVRGSAQDLARQAEGNQVEADEVEAARVQETESDEPLSNARNPVGGLEQSPETVANPEAVSRRDQPQIRQDVVEVQSVPTQSSSQKADDQRRLIQDENEQDVATSWHIDISKYYGTVPSSHVATLLFRSADWGVRSWTMRGQTTYYTKSFNDLQDAQAVLEEVRREGFINAELVED